MNVQEFALYLKIGLLVFLFAVGLFKLLAPRETYARWRVGVLVLLGIAALLSFGTYVRFGNFLHGATLHYHDISHYYFGAKYADELGYFKLYECVVTAEVEMLGVSGTRRLPKRMKESRIRDLRTYRHQSLEEMAENPAIAASCMERFSPERWEEFKEDLRRFYKVQKRNSLYQRCGDMGYNGSPVWGMVMNRIATWVPISNFNLNALSGLDYLLLLVGFGFVFWAFGAELALMALIFYFCVVFNHRMFIIGSILRFDWMAAILIGLSLLKKGHYKTSAVFFSFSGLVRLFPVMLMFGMGVKFLYDLFTTREKFRQYLGFILTYALTGAILVGASLAFFGVDYYREYGEKLSVHSKPLTSTRAGMPYVIMWEGEGKRADLKRLAGVSAWDDILAHKAAVKSHRLPLRLVFLGLMFAMLVMAMRQREDWEAVALSYAVIFLLMAITIYYIVVIVLLFMVFAWRDNDHRHWVSFSALMAGMIALYPVTLNVGFGLTQNFIVSAVILLVLILALVLFVRSDEAVMARLGALWRKSIGRPASRAGRGLALAAFLLLIAGFLYWQLAPIASPAARKNWQQETEALLKKYGYDNRSDILAITPVSLRHEWVRRDYPRRVVFVNRLDQETFHPFERIWVLSSGGAFAPGDGLGRPVLVSQTFDVETGRHERDMKLHLVTFEPSPRSTYCFRDELGQALVSMGDSDEGHSTPCPYVKGRHRCSESGWNYVGRVNKMVGGEDRLTIWSHPSDPPLVISFPAVRLEDSLRIGAGLEDGVVDSPDLSPVRMEILANGTQIGQIVAPNQRGWTWHEIDTTPWKGQSVTLRFRIRAASLDRRHFLWSGDVLSAP